MKLPVLGTAHRFLTVASSALIAAVALAACSGGGGGSIPQTTSQSPSTGSNANNPPTTSSNETIRSASVTATDTAAAKGATNMQRHPLLVSSFRQKTAAAAPPTVQYLQDLAYAGGHVLTNVTEHNIYVSVNSSIPTPTTWGNPYKFLYDLGASSFIHLTDQYTKTSGHYVPGLSLSVSNSNLGFAPLYDNDILALTHAVARLVKQPGETGYERIYNLFFPPGVDICFTFTTQCYSPDNLSTFAFCGYHESVDFADVGHVLLTVEPYAAALVNVNGQQVPACSTQNPSSPNFVATATNSVVSHETFESITDPDPGFGWYVPYSNGGVAGGYEIGDLCAYAPVEQSTLNGTLYAIQPEYSNLVHGCANDNIKAASAQLQTHT